MQLQVHHYHWNLSSFGEVVLCGEWPEWVALKSMQLAPVLDGVESDVAGVSVVTNVSLL